jgi:cell pole-organizing protein PopZ
MEEILASIRRIISDDQSPPPAREQARMELKTEFEVPASPKWHQGNAQRDEPKVLENGHVARAPSSLGPNLSDLRRSESPLRHESTSQTHLSETQTVAHQTAVKPDDFSDFNLRQRLDDGGMGQPPARPALKRSIDPVPLVNEEAPIVSPATDAAVATSFNALFASQLLPNADVLAEMARDMLRPMLKAWLDDNLPVMVERLVRAEIERVARGGR